MKNEPIKLSSLIFEQIRWMVLMLLLLFMSLGILVTIR